MSAYSSVPFVSRMPQAATACPPGPGSGPEPGPEPGPDPGPGPGQTPSWCSDNGTAGLVTPRSPAPPSYQGLGPAKHGLQPAQPACSDPGGGGPGGGP